MIAWLLACTGPDPVDTGTSICADPPYVSWDTFGQGFMLEQCQPCHSSAAPTRYGAPEAVTFDTYELTVAQKASVLRVATGDAPTMPPALSVEERDRYLLEVWLTCWE